MTTHPLPTSNNQPQNQRETCQSLSLYNTKGPSATVLILSSAPATLVSILPMKCHHSSRMLPSVVLLDLQTFQNGVETQRKFPEVGCFPGPLHPVTAFSPCNSGLHAHRFSRHSIHLLPLSLKPGSERSGQAPLPLKQLSKDTYCPRFTVSDTVTPLEGTSARKEN